MESSSSNKNKTDVAHNSLADIPINAVLIGVFAEALKNLGHLKEKHEYPEFITIPNSSASDEAGTFDNTYKFKSVDVRNYLEHMYPIDMFNKIVMFQNSEKTNVENTLKYVNAQLLEMHIYSGNINMLANIDKLKNIGKAKKRCTGKPACSVRP